MKYKPNDRVIVYENTPFYRYGSLCVVVDRDPIDNTYAVVDLSLLAKKKFSTENLGQDIQWAKVDQMELVAIYEPKSKISLIFKKIREWTIRLREKLFKP